VSFDNPNQRWVITAPTNLAGNTLISAVAWPVPSAGLPAGIQNVGWQGLLTSDAPNVTLNWKWAAAAYSAGFPADYNSLNVKPVDAASALPWKNSDRAGTPENEKQHVTPGATGNGGNNYTGDYSGGVGVSAVFAPFVVSPDSLNFGNVSAGNVGTTCNTASGACTISVTNPGTDSLPLTISVTGTENKEFTVLSNSCGSSLAAEASCAVTLTFTPAALGTRSATLSIGTTVNGTAGTQTVALAGYGM
jgi:hypothetical protein